MLRRGLQRQAFTLIELLISISIIGILLALVIPSIDKSLSGNDLANDAEIFKSKVEETRLLASSTQQIDTVAANERAYYAVFLPAGTEHYYAIVRITSASGSACLIATVATTLPPACVVQRIEFSRKVVSGNGTPRFILFGVPTQQTFTAVAAGATWPIVAPAANVTFPLTYNTKTATLTIEAYTAKVTISY